MENKPAILIVVPLGKAFSGVPSSWFGRQAVLGTISWKSSPSRVNDVESSQFAPQTRVESRLYSLV